MEINLPVYSSMTAACLMIMQLGLMLAVGLARVKHTQGIGDGGHDDLAQSIRRHGNLAENAAMFIVVLALLEMIGGAPRYVMMLGGGFVIVRVFHAIGLTLGSGPNGPRFIGAMGTVGLGVVSAIYLLIVAATAIG